jgi:DNA-binding CsgD family transcriptional regulator
MGPPAKLIRKLSGRERQIAALIRQGLTYKQIAAQLNIAPGTVAAYVRRIFARLTISNRTMLEAMWVGEVAPGRSIGRRRRFARARPAREGGERSEPGEGPASPLGEV